MVENWAQAMLMKWVMGNAANSEDFQEQGKPLPLRSQSALNLPPEEPWPEPVDGRTLLDEIPS